MSWKKDRFSYVVWIIYVLLVGVGLSGLTETLCASFHIRFSVGIAVCAFSIGILGLLVFLISRYGFRYSESGKKDHGVRIAVEAAAAVLFLAVGLVLRIQGMDGAGEKAAYFETASVAMGQRIPTLVHGAVYFYLHLLHSVFYFLGNKFVMGIWLQILLQFGAILALYFTVRYVAGHMAAIIMLGFCMCSPFMIQGALTLSPEMLYLLLLAGTFAWVVAGYRGRLKAYRFLWTGILIAVMGYLDVAGFLLLLPAVAVILCTRNGKPENGTKVKTLLLCLAGVAVGFAGCLLADACLSGKNAKGVLQAWLQLYSPDGFRIPVSLEHSGITADYMILFALLVIGVFGFLRDKKSDHIKLWVLGAVILIFSGCFGVFTQDMPAHTYLFVVLALLAGIGVENCFRPLEQERSQNGEEPQTVQTSKPQTALTQEPQQEVSDGQVKPVKLIENPLPLPKKHVKRILDYDLKDDILKDDFDIPLDENDDFDV